MPRPLSTCTLSPQGDACVAPTKVHSSRQRRVCVRRGEACLAPFPLAPCRRRATHASPLRRFTLRGNEGSVFVGARHASPLSTCTPVAAGRRMHRPYEGSLFAAAP